MTYRPPKHTCRLYLKSIWALTPKVYRGRNLYKQWPSSKNNKSPGRAGITTEMVKLLDHTNLEIMLYLLGTCWKNNTSPLNVDEATIVTLFQKGDTKNLANYRPVALLKILYKIFYMDRCVNLSIVCGGVFRAFFLMEFPYEWKLKRCFSLSHFRGGRGVRGSGKKSYPNWTKKQALMLRSSSA